VLYIKAGAATLAGAWFIHWPVRCGRCVVYTDRFVPKTFRSQERKVSMECVSEEKDLGLIISKDLKCEKQRS